MGIKKRRENEIEDMKNRIIRAAGELITEGGYEEASIRKIADKIDYSPTTIYIYYKDKAAIISDMAKRMYQHSMEEVESYLERNEREELSVQVKGAFLVLVESLTDRPEIANAVLRSGMNLIFDPKSKEEQDSSGLTILHYQLLTGVRKRVFHSVTEHTPWMLITALLGFVMYSIENKLYLQSDFKDMAEEYIELILKGIIVQP